MMKKPLFWIIMVIVIVILWFVFAGEHKQAVTSKATTPTSTPTTSSTPASSHS